MSDAIDRYLGCLGAQLGRREVDAARLVEEAEAHLRDTQLALVAAGWPADAAAEEAVTRFGGPGAVVARLPRAGGSVARQVVVALAPVALVAMVALGAGALLALCVTWAVHRERVGITDSTVWAEVLIGVLGLAALETLWRRRSGRPARASGLPARFVPAAGCVSFGVATAVLLAYGGLLVWSDHSLHLPRPLLTALAYLGGAVFYGAQLAHGRTRRQA